MIIIGRGKLAMQGKLLNSYHEEGKRNLLFHIMSKIIHNIKDIKVIKLNKFNFKVQKLSNKVNSLK